MTMEFLLFAAQAALFMLYITITKTTDASSALVTTSSSFDDHEEHSGDICQWETFNATCGEGSVVIVTQAKYGRMRQVRCLNTELGHVGCAADVIGWADSQCSGRRSCQLRLPDRYLDDVPRPCSKDLRAYLSVTYICLPVQTAQPGEGCKDTRLPIKDTPVGYLSNAVAAARKLGTRSCPWAVVALPGQKIRLSVLDFALWTPDGSGSRSPERSGVCHIYAKVSEDEAFSSVTVCGGDRREKEVYSAESHVIEVEFPEIYGKEPTGYFLIKYEVIGCPDISLLNAVIDRSGDLARIRCVTSSHEWHVTCVAGKWSPVVSTVNCTDTRGVWIACIVAIALLVSTVILTVGVYCIRRRPRDHHHQWSKDPMRVADYALQQNIIWGQGQGHGTLKVKDIYHGYEPPPDAGFDPMALTLTYPYTDEDYGATLHRVQQHRLKMSMQQHQTDGGPCPVHTGGRASMGRGYGSTGGRGQGQRSGRGGEHVYESPKFMRAAASRAVGTGEPIPPQYHVLDRADHEDALTDSSGGRSLASLPRGMFSANGT